MQGPTNTMHHSGGLQPMAAGPSAPLGGTPVTIYQVRPGLPSLRGMAPSEEDTPGPTTQRKYCAEHAGDTRAFRLLPGGKARLLLLLPSYSTQPGMHCTTLMREKKAVVWPKASLHSVRPNRENIFLASGRLQRGPTILYENCGMNSFQGTNVANRMHRPLGLTLSTQIR